MEEVVISDRFKEKAVEYKIYEQFQKMEQAAYKGSILRLEEDLYILRDKNNNDICGILDPQSFYEALMDTDVSHLWCFDNKVKKGAAN